MGDLYDISNYTPEQLYEILDLDNPSDRELEAKILMMIHKYENMKNKSGRRLSSFFEKIYNHFFEDSDEETDDEGIVEGLTAMEASELYQTSNDGTTSKEISYAGNTVPTSASDISLNDLKIQGDALDNLAITSTRRSGAATSSEYQGADKEATKEVIYTTQLPYARGTLNPILKQTTKRIISIDSQYRPDKTTGSTEFTCNLSEPLKDVVSLKLYSIQIPFTWYTIGKSYGSNFFYFKGRTTGIDTETHDIQVPILPGNYKPQELIDTVNIAIQTTNNNIDTDIANSIFVYNQNTSLSHFTANIKKLFNQSSYYLSFPEWSSPYQVDASRNTTIPGYLGFQTDQYDINVLKSPLHTSFNNVNIADTTAFALTSNNNYMKIIKYSGTDTYNETSSIIDVSTNITFSLSIDNSYTRSELISDMNTQINNNEKLTNSHIQQNNIDTRNDQTSTVSQVELKLNYNRLHVDPNITNSHLVILFPPEDKTIWTDANSCFRFDASENELNIIQTDVSPVAQNDRYIITNNPYVEFICTAEHFDISENDLSFNLPNSAGVGYTITEYIDAINTSMRTYDVSYNIQYGYNVLNAPTSTYEFNSALETYPSGSFTYIDETNNNFNIFLDINKKFDESTYEIDLQGGIFETIIKLIVSPNLYYTELTDLTKTYNSKVAIASREISPTDIICIIKPKSGGGNEFDINYTLTFESVITTAAFYTYTQIETMLNTIFNDYIDPISGRNIFQGTTLSNSVENNLYEIQFNITINKLLIAKNYKVRFVDDIDNNSWSNNLFVDTLMTPNYYDMSFNIPTVGSNVQTTLIDNVNVQISEINTNGDILITANNQIAQSNPLNIQTGINDTLIFKAYEDGVISDNGENDIIIAVPEGYYSTDLLIQTINTKIQAYSGVAGINTVFEVVKGSDGNNYIKIINKIERTYTAKDYNLVFYDRISFSQCFTGTKSIQNTTWDTTVGWIMGFREYTEYDLSAEDFNNNNNNITSFFGDTGISTSLFNYFLLCLDDYNQNRLNDGLVTITGTDTGVPLPSYANRSELQCDPVSGELVYNNTAGLTQNQIYATNQIANASETNTAIGSSVSSKSYGSGPFVTDVFGLIPVKTNGLINGAPYVEFGGTLQNQERSYFGPVNISRFSVRLVTDRGNNVDLNNANWSFSLICEQLNKLEPTE